MTIPDTRPPRADWARWLPWAAVALALVVHLPALTAPFMLDDHAQAAMAEGRFGAPRAPWDLYNYIDATNRASLFERGIIPWWTDPHLVVRFMRPLSSVLLWADYHVFGARPLWHHLHSLVWWCVAVLGVHTLLARSFRRRAAFFGTLIFALAPCHAVPLVWLANREVLVSTALGVWALVAYGRWREQGRSRDGLASLALFGVAMLAGEYTMCFAGYVLAIELTHPREALWKRGLGLLAFALPAAAYVAVHVLLGYDASGTGFYRNPIHDPATYALGAPRRLAILLGSAWLGVDETWVLSPSWALAVLGAVTVLVLALLAVYVLGRLDPDERRRAWWMLVGSVLSLAPVLSVEASKRLLGVCMVGVSAVVGLVLDRVWFPEVPAPRRGLAELVGLVALGLGFVHLVRAPVETLVIMRASTRGAEAYLSRLEWLRANLNPTCSTAVVLQAESSETVLWGPLLLGDRAPARWRVLSFLSGRSLLLRTGPRTFELVQSERPLFAVGPDDLFRGPGSLKPGATVNLPGLKATIVQVDEHDLPKRLRFELDRDLDDPSVQWMSERESGFQETKPPPTGYGAPVLP